MTQNSDIPTPTESSSPSTALFSSLPLQEEGDLGPWQNVLVQKGLKATVILRKTDE